MQRKLRIKVKAFGITKDILGGREHVVDLQGTTVQDLKRQLQEQYPAMMALRSLFVAVNQTYAEDQQLLNENDEIALIPPVSGG